MTSIQKNQKSTVDSLCILLFQGCVVLDGVLGFDARLFQLSKLCMLAFFLVMVLRILNRGNVMVGPSLIAPILFMLLIVMSCLWGDYPSYSLSRLGTQLQLYILFFFVYFLYMDGIADIKTYLNALYVTGVGMALLALYRYGLSGILDGLDNGERIGGEITNENIFGMVFSRAAMVSFYYCLKAKPGKKRIAHMAATVIFTLFAFSSGSKKAVLMVFTGVLCICFLEFGFKKLWKALLIGAIAVVALIFTIRLPMFSTINQRITDFFSGTKDASDTVRATMIQQSMELFKERPLLGHGLHSFGIITGWQTYSHNNFTEVLVSVGAVGFAFFYFPYLQTIYWGWKAGVQKKDYTVTLFLILTLINLVFGYAMVLCYEKSYWMFMGVMIASLDRRKISGEGVKL